MSLPSGLIFVWSGAIVDIPAGYILCNGNGGTPDLRNRFIVGAGDSYNPDDNGGSVNHDHTFIGDGHGHGLVPGSGVGAGANWDSDTALSNAEGTTDSASTLPPYYALAYIMKT